MDKRTLAVLGSTGFLLLGLFIHTAQWGPHSLQILKIKQKELTDGLTTTERRQLIGICRERQLPHCVAHNLYSLHKQQPQDAQTLGELGQAFAVLGERDAALQAFKRYVTLGGKNHNVRYQYAVQLAEAGDIHNAKREFERLLRSRPDTLQVTVVKTYVAALIKHKKIKEAQKVLREFRAQGGNAMHHLGKEINEVERQVSSLDREV